MVERDHLADRARRAAEAAVAPARIAGVLIRTRNPFVFTINEIPHQNLTDAQRAAARAAVAALDPTPRVEKSLADLSAEVSAWLGPGITMDPAKAKRALALLVADALRRYPRLGRDNGVPVDGDQ